MKKFVGYLLLLIFLNGFAIQICKSYCADFNVIENMADNEEESKKSIDDILDFLKDKITNQSNFNSVNFEVSLKQYSDHFFQYKNPHHEVDIIPPESVI